MNPKIFVVGSSNIDQFSYASNMPKDGETVFGESYETGFGGKGANQAVMIGLLGSDAYIITCLGDDLFADATLENYKNNLVNVDFVQRVSGSSGVAPIWVDSKGENRIIVIPGANSKIDSKKAILDIQKVRDISVIVGQCEIPMKINNEIFKFAKENNITTIFNPAPGKYLNSEFLNYIDWLIPNETEFEIVSKTNLNEENLIKFNGQIKGGLIVTLGERGAAYVKSDKIEYFDAPKVKVVDTTGAGDAFVGTFAHAIGMSKSPEEAIRLAIEKSSLSVTKKGTQSSYSSSSE